MGEEVKTQKKKKKKEEVKRGRNEKGGMGKGRG